MKTAAEVNVERIAAIINARKLGIGTSIINGIARRIVEAIPELRPAQQRMERGDIGGQIIAAPLPWAKP